jgi:hypothetical protein
MKAINFDDDKWTASEAIGNLFFSDLDLDWKDTDCVNNLGAFVHCIVDLRKNDAVSLAADVRENVQSVVTQLVEKFSWIKVDLVAPPLLWQRFAFQAMIRGIKPSVTFFKRYEGWRNARAETHGLERVYRSVAAVKPSGSKKKARPPVEKPRGYTIDEFLLYDSVKADPGGRTNWELRPVQAKPAAETLPSSKARARKAQSSAKKGASRNIRDVVGAKLYDLVGECVGEDAENLRKTHIGIKNRTGRYHSDVSRTELVAALQKKHKQLRMYSSNTIARALSDFVACRNYRRWKTAA